MFSLIWIDRGGQTGTENSPETRCMQLEQELQLMIYIGRGENMETYRITCYNIISITEAIGIENKMHKADAYLPNIDVWENMLGYLSAGWYNSQPQTHKLPRTIDVFPLKCVSIQ